MLGQGTSSKQRGLYRHVTLAQHIIADTVDTRTLAADAVDTRTLATQHVEADTVDTRTFQSADVSSLQSDLKTFDAATSIDDSYCISLQGHGLSTGDYVIYLSGENADLTNLVDRTLYRVIVQDADKFKLATVADPNTALLISAGTGTHSLNTAMIATLAARVATLESAPAPASESQSTSTPATGVPSADIQVFFVHSGAPQSDTDYTGSINAFTDPSNSSVTALPVTGTVTWGPNGVKTVSNSSIRLRAAQAITPPFSFEWYGELPFTGTWQRVIAGDYLTTQYNLVLSRYGNSTTDIYFGDDSHGWNNNDTILSGNGVKAAIDTTNLQHVVCVAPSEGAMKMFINNVMHIANTTYTLPSANREIHIGRDGYGDSGEELTRFVRFWDSVALTDTQVQDLFTAKDS